MDASIPEIMNCMDSMKKEILEHKIESKKEYKKEILENKIECKKEIKILRKENQELKKKSDATAKQLKEEEVIINAYRIGLSVSMEQI